VGNNLQVRTTTTKPDRRHPVIPEMSDCGRCEGQDDLQSRLQTLSDATFEGIGFSERGVVVDVNQQLADMLGYEIDEMVGLKVSLFVAPEDQDYVREQILSGIEGPYEHRSLRKDGSVIFVEARARMMEINGRMTRVTAVRDISARRRAEEEKHQALADALEAKNALQASQTELATIFESAPVMMALVDGERRIRKANRAVVESIGKSREEIVGLRGGEALRCLHALDDPRGCGFGPSCESCLLRLVVVDTLEGGRSHHQEDVTLLLAGEVAPKRVNLLVSTSSVAVAGVEMVLVCLDDITEHKKAEEGKRRALAEGLRAAQALQESEERYRALFEHANDAIFVENLDDRIVDVNRRACELMGYSRQELLGMQVADLVAPELRGPAGNIVSNELALYSSAPFESVNYHRDGSRIPVEVSISRFGDGDLALAIVRDIGERKRAETEREVLLTQVREQAQQVEEIIDTVPDGVLLLDPEYRVLVANPEAREYLAVLAGVGVGGKLSALSDRPINELLTSPPKGTWHELQLAGPPRRVFETIARPFEGGPETNGWVLVLRDVTEKREIQRRAQQQERLAALGQLAAGIAHDFNNNLAVITLYSQMLQRTPNLSQQERERLKVVAEQAKRAAGLTAQILDFSRRSVLEQQTLDLARFLQELVEILRRTLEEKVQVNLSLGTDSYMIHADPTRLQQVLMNLAINARDAMLEGGVLSISVERTGTDSGGQRCPHGTPSGDWIRLTVSDTGVGIPPEDIPHIFEPFYTTKTNGKGTGLGLAQVWGIVQQHQGHISVTSQLGEGTTFTLCLPALPETRQHVPSAGAEELPTGRGETILVVEDDAIMREALVASLTALDYRVLIASNGLEAAAILEAHTGDSGLHPEMPISLVLSDMVMPEMGGQALFHLLQKQNPEVKMILLTGHPMGDKLEDLKRQGLSAWLAKPPSLAQLAQVVSQVLEQD
jgi:PAS domain S-box-containing protein